MSVVRKVSIVGPSTYPELPPPNGSKCEEEEEEKNGLGPGNPVKESANKPFEKPPCRVPKNKQNIYSIYC